LLNFALVFILMNRLLYKQVETVKLPF